MNSSSGCVAIELDQFWFYLQKFGPLFCFVGVVFGTLICLAGRLIQTQVLFSTTLTMCVATLCPAFYLVFNKAGI